MGCHTLQDRLIYAELFAGGCLPFLHVALWVVSKVVSNGISRSRVPMSLTAPKTSPRQPCGTLSSTPILVTLCGYSVGANGRLIPVGEVSISVLDFSNKARCPGKNCPNNSGNHPLPPGIVALLE
jgi:hypothetical protein